jgi:hypothetical protein
MFDFHHSNVAGYSIASNSCSCSDLPSVIREMISGVAAISSDLVPATIVPSVMS